MKGLIDLFGQIPKGGPEFTRRMRIHQGWWRAFVLGEEPGQHPIDPTKTVCSTIVDGATSKKNFISENAWKAYQETLLEHKLNRTGIVEEDRAVNNLLSSQPLCFNFFGELKQDLTFATTVLRLWFPNIQQVENVWFEYGLPKSIALDISAFDVAFHFKAADGQRGLFGIECKYTDPFSGVAKDRKIYREVFERSSGVFARPYKEYFTKQSNQLFRNQLMAERLKQLREYDDVVTGIFCHYEDTDTLSAARRFQQEMLIDGQQRFRIITFKDFIATVQRIELFWKQREWLMLLWARYCALQLSRGIAGFI